MDKFLVRSAKAAALCDLGTRTFERLKAAGKIGPRPIRLGGSVRWDVAELAEWCRSQKPDGTLPNRVEWDAPRKRIAR